MRLAKGYLLALTAVFLVLTAALVQPFLQYVLGAILLAYALYPLQIRLEDHVSSATAALGLVVLAVIGFVGPFVVILSSVSDDALEILQSLDPDSVRIEQIESLIQEYTGLEVDIVGELVESSQEIGTAIFEQSTAAFSSLLNFAIGIVLALFLVYYLLKDGDDLVDWLYETVPLPTSIQRDLYAEFHDLLWAVLFGHVLVGVVQGVVAGIGFFATGVPNAGFWTVVMVVFAMVPLVGTIPIWGGAVVYLLLTGEPVLAVVLFVYSVVVVGITDDYLRPFAVDRYARLNPAVILLGILGGAYAFGVMGLFFGPVFLGGLKATLHVVSEHWNRLDDLDRQ